MKSSITLSCTFLPTQEVKDLLCALYAEYMCGGKTTVLLRFLKMHLGLEEYRNFEKDLVALMKVMSAAAAVRRIVQEAISRDRKHYSSLNVTQVPLSRSFYQKFVVY